MEAELGPHWGRPASVSEAESPEWWDQSEGLDLGLYFSLWFLALEVVEVEEQEGATAWSTSP